VILGRLGGSSLRGLGRHPPGPWRPCRIHRVSRSSGLYAKGHLRRFPASCVLNPFRVRHLGVRAVARYPSEPPGPESRTPALLGWRGTMWRVRHPFGHVLTVGIGRWNTHLHLHLHDGNGECLGEQVSYVVQGAGHAGGRRPRRGRRQGRDRRPAPRRTRRGRSRTPGRATAAVQRAAVRWRTRAATRSAHRAHRRCRAVPASVAEAGRTRGPPPRRGGPGVGARHLPCPEPMRLISRTSNTAGTGP
jgi:hypothetical protein